MTDNMNKPSKHGLRRPPNDGAPRPNPPCTGQEGEAMSELPVDLDKAIAKLDDLAKAATGCGGYLQAETVRNYVRRIRKAMAEVIQPAAEALDSAHTVMVHDARDWSLSSRDAWMYGLLVGWDDESLAQILTQHPRWKPEGIERLKRLRAGLAAIYDGDLAAHKDGTL